jgi:hypothetical protein
MKDRNVLRAGCFSSERATAALQPLSADRSLVRVFNSTPAG